MIFVSISYYGFTIRINNQRKFMSALKGLKLNLGCNQNYLDGWTNVDIEQYGKVDVCTDLNDPWPWDDNSVDYITAYNIVEHLKDPIHVMNEAWRVLKPGAAFEIYVPSTDGRGAFQDPTHISFWNENSFAYYTQEGLGNIYSSIKCDYDVILFNTPATSHKIIWVWAICRALKESLESPLLTHNTILRIGQEMAANFDAKPKEMKDILVNFQR